MIPNNSFGKLVRDRRRDLDLTQAELSRRVGCATITVRKIEANALRPSVQIAERLAMALSIPLEDRAAFVRLARTAQLAEPSPPPIPTPVVQRGEIGLGDLSGRAIRGYALGERIGEGGFGAVYRAVQPIIERDVAIKIILPKYADQPDFIRRFEAEAKTVARLEHPHVVPLYDYWREPGVAYLVMRLMRGESLHDALQNGALPLDRAIQMMDQISSALHAAHRMGVIHRDIKPANILLDDDGNAYLSDFGIAKNMNVDGKTEHGELIGSLAYLSPEQILSEPIRPQTDIYCLGILFYEMLTGHKPFQGPTPVAYIQQHLNDPLPLLAAYNSDLPAELDPVIAKATAKRQEDRFLDIVSMMTAVNRALQNDRQTIAAAPLDGVAATAVDMSTQDWAKLENPYKGLHAFSEADAHHFFGRETLIQELMGQLESPYELARFLAVVGPSGGGKSSVVKAGLLPALRRGGLPGSENWYAIDLTPGAHPWEELEAALLRIAVNPPDSLLAQLQDGDRGLLRAVNRILPADETTELTLVIDQFEEMFTLVANETVREQFLNSLITAVLDERSRLRIIITLRADFYDRPLQYVDFGDLLRQRTVSVLPMTADELEEAITQPAAQTGVILESGLAAAIIRDVGDQPGTLPLLQYALTELFARRERHQMTQAVYRDFGGVAGALARRAEEIYEGLDDDGRAAARQLFLRLITLGEGVEDTRRRVMRAELAALIVEDSNNEQASDGRRLSAVLDNVIVQFGKYRLLTFDRDPLTREPTVEVAHEALLREWERLRLWLDENREDVRRQRLLAAATAEWLAAEKDDGFLLHGGRLDQFGGWAEYTTIALTYEERDFLAASLSTRQVRQTEEEARRRRELETAQQLAKSERQRAEEQTQTNRRLRWGAVFLAGALLVAAMLAVLANSASRSANKNALAAQSSAELAMTREAEAVSEAEQRVVAEALAIQEREEAQAQGRQAQAGALAGAAVNNMQVDPELSVLLALQAVETTYAADGTWAPEAVDALHRAIRSASRLQSILIHPGGAVNGVAYSPDGSMLVAVTLLSGQEVMTAVWDAETGRELFTLPNTIARFSKDNKRLMTWRVSDLNLIWDSWDIATVEKAESTSLLIDDLWVSAGGRLSPDWQYFAIKYWDNRVNVWQMSTQEKILQLTEHSDMVNAVEFSPDSKFLATASRDGTAKVWPMPTGSADLNDAAESILTLEHADAVEVLTFSADSKYLATVSHDFTAVIWDLSASIATGSPVAVFTFSLTGHAEQIRQIMFSADSSQLAVVSQDGLVKVWDATTGEGLLTLVSNDLTRGIAFDPNGTHLVTGNDGGLVQIWDITPAGEKERLTLAGHDGAVNRATYSPDGAQLATVSSDETVKLWDSVSGNLLTTLEGHTDDVRAVTFCPDGSCLATASNDGTIKLWDLAAGRELSVLNAYLDLSLNPIPENNVLDLAFTPDGSRLVSVGMDNEPDVWDTATGERLMALEDHWYNVVSTAVSPDGRRLATTSPDGMMIIWDSRTGESLFIQDTSEYGSKDVVFSPDGGRAATADNDGAVRVWDLNAQEGERLLLTLSGHGSSVRSVAFSPDGRYLASASANHIRVWDAETGQLLFTLPGHTRVVLDIEFSPDGSRLVSASADGTVRIFALPIEELMGLARSRLTRSLSDEECQQYLHVEKCPDSP